MRAYLGNSGGVIVSKLDEQTFTNDFDSHWVPNSYDLMSWLNKKV